MKALETPLYLKGLHNLLSSLFYLSHYDRFVEVMDKLKAFETTYKVKQNTNVEGMLQLFKYIHRINFHYLEGTFEEGLKFVPELEKILSTNQYNWDPYRIMVFNYRIACLYFGNGNNNEAIDYLNRIINFSIGHLGEDIQCFARILNLIAHYELGHYNLLEHLVKSVYRFLRKMEELNAVQEEILRFLRKSLNANPQNLTESFVNLRTRLVPHTNNPVERRSFLYLDIISWLTSKIERRPVQDVIREKFKAEKR